MNLVNWAKNSNMVKLLRATRPETAARLDKAFQLTPFFAEKAPQDAPTWDEIEQLLVPLSIDNPEIVEQAKMLKAKIEELTATDTTTKTEKYEPDWKYLEKQELTVGLIDKYKEAWKLLPRDPHPDYFKQLEYSLKKVQDDFMLEYKAAEELMPDHQMEAQMGFQQYAELVQLSERFKTGKMTIWEVPGAEAVAKQVMHDTHVEEDYSIPDEDEQVSLLKRLYDDYDLAKMGIPPIVDSPDREIEVKYPHEESDWPVPGFKIEDYLPKEEKKEEKL